MAERKREDLAGTQEGGNRGTECPLVDNGSGNHKEEDLVDKPVEVLFGRGATECSAGRSVRDLVLGDEEMARDAPTPQGEHHASLAGRNN